MSSTVDNLSCDRQTWTTEVAKRFPEAEIRREGNWTWAIFDGEDVAMYSAVLGGGWIKR